jgi:alkylation response protein AidB-like acyl-CoA dehydrogenase
MDFRLGAEEEAFRNEVKEFLHRELPAGWRGTVGWEPASGEHDELERDFYCKLAEKRWLVLTWPRQFGGLGLSYMLGSIFIEEMAYHRAPGRGWTPASAIVGPTIIIHGTEEQKSEYLPPIVEGKVSWCQSFTEPIGGSDVANCKTRAVEDGDEFIVNGQKTFIGGADRADWCYMIVRTNADVPKHKGLSYLLVDMKTPGITVRPFRNMLGAHIFNDVFFDDVRVPKKNLLGEKDRGWYITVTTLDLERHVVMAGTGEYRRLLDDLVAYCGETKRDGKALIRDVVVRHELAERAIETEVSRLLNYRVLWMADRGIIANYEASMAKLYATELAQRLTNTGMEILRLHGQLKQESKWAPLKGIIASLCLSLPSQTIQGGTSEIQRNVIATRGLRLPRGW